MEVVMFTERIGSGTQSNGTHRSNCTEQDSHTYLQQTRQKHFNTMPNTLLNNSHFHRNVHDTL